ncbi:major facilitator superfamily domain-containing protein [Hyaloraphidium curvatum]|nr:major facilitator superfamily domain-containing protein [Hyaloraphidium curvatum]
MVDDGIDGRRRANGHVPHGPPSPRDDEEAERAAWPDDDHGHPRGADPTNKERTLLSVYAFIAVYAASYHMSFPIYPFLVAKYAGGSVADGQRAFGAWKSFNQTLQLLGSLVAGSLVDRMGCKHVIELSFAASFACYALLAAAMDLPTLYASQFPALLQHVLLASRAYVSFLVTNEERTVAFGRLAMSYGIGAVVGPAIGGVLGKTSFALPGVVSAGACLATGIVVSRTLPDIHAAATQQKIDSLKAEIMPDTSALGSYARLFTSPTVAPILLNKLFFSVAVALFNAAVSMVSGPLFGMDTASSGFLMSYLGICSILSQAVLVQPAVRLFSPHSITLISGAVLVPLYILFAFSSSAPHLYLLSTPIVVFNMLQGLVSTQEAVAVAPASLRGSLIGADQALGSGGRMLAPWMASVLLSVAGLGGVGGASAAFVGLGLVGMVFVRRPQAKEE